MARSPNVSKKVAFKKAHGFYPKDEECGICGQPRINHDNGQVNCEFEHTGRKFKRTGARSYFP